MLLTKIDYSEQAKTDYEWHIEGVNFGKFNLIIGQNTAGKSRSLRIVSALANIISGKSKLTNGSWKAEFSLAKKKYIYELVIAEQKIKKERLELDGEELLKRNSVSFIKSLHGEEKKISPPDDLLILQVRRDKKEYPFLEDLVEWGNNYNSYEFIQSPRNFLLDLQPGDLSSVKISNLESAGTILNSILHDSSDEGKELKKQIIADLNEIGFPIKKIETKQIVASGVMIQKSILVAKEADLQCNTDQIKMSDGMFRAYATIVIIEYLLSKNKPLTISIDDIGEGLDYERGAKLAKLLLARLEKSKIQFISATNDKFLAGAIDINYWNVLKRKGNKITAYNYTKNKDDFDKFKMSDLNRFDLLTSNFLEKSDDE